MKTKHLMVMLAAAVGAAAFTLYLAGRGKERKMLEKVADEGYETAPDILFPGKKGNLKLHYGPVIPS